MRPGGAIIDGGQIAVIDTPEWLKRTFRRVQSLEVALEPDGQIHGVTLAVLPGVTRSVKMGVSGDWTLKIRQRCCPR